MIVLVSVVIVVIISTFFVNRSIQSIVGEISDEVKPDERLALLKGVMFDIANAENNVKSFGLTHNQDYLDNYEISISEVDSGIHQLYKQSTEDQEFKTKVDRIDSLQKKKFQILDELLIVQSQQGVGTLIKKVQDRVDDISRKTVIVQESQEPLVLENSVEIVPENNIVQEDAVQEDAVQEDVVQEDEVEKEKLIKRIFGNRKKRKNSEEAEEVADVSEELPVEGPDNYSVVETTEDVPVENNSTADQVQASFKKIDRELNHLKEEESEYEIALKAQELCLIQADKVIMDEISEVVVDLELTEQNRMQSQIEKANDQSYFTGLVIALFCFISCLLLILAGYAVYAYVKRNNAYEKALLTAKNETESKNQQILASINYAKRIQNSILPDLKKIEAMLPTSFIFYKPKDIVAGDFYWAIEIDSYVYVAAADCTGHGVPGAMVSMSCSSALNRAVKEFNLRQPAEILDKCRELVINAFDEGEHTVYDGMDISLCRIDRSRNKIEYAGANNSLYKVNSTVLTEIKADKQPVARYQKARPFTNHSLDIEKGDTFFLFTDGYADQFGGDKGKKYKYLNFQKLLSKNAHLSPNVLHDGLLQAFHDWKGDYDQIDDVCVIGFRV